jgi:1,4-dihydroxy-2-naphthoyl-CoA hydrolase
MAIWFKEFPLSYAQERGRGTLIEHLGIELFEAGEDYLRARMPVNAHTRQPAGMLHGGASVALAENACLVGGNLLRRPQQASLRGN